MDDLARGSGRRRVPLLEELTVHMLNLDQVYLGGFFDQEDAEVGEIFLSAIRRNWSYPTPPSSDVAFSSYGSFAVAFGAAGLFLERAFRDPGALAYLGLESGVPLLMQGPITRAPVREAA